MTLVAWSRVETVTLEVVLLVEVLFVLERWNRGRNPLGNNLLLHVILHVNSVVGCLASMVDPQNGRRIHELSGKRLLCHCKLHEDCHGRNFQDLFRRLHPHAFDQACSDRPPLSSELNILAKAREEREDSEESGLEDAVANAPQGWLGAGKNPWSLVLDMSRGGCVTVKGYARQALGLQRTGTILPHFCGKVSHAFSLVQQSQSPQCSSCQSSLWVVMGSRRSVKTLFGG